MFAQHGARYASLLPAALEGAASLKLDYDGRMAGGSP